VKIGDEIVEKSRFRLFPGVNGLARGLLYGKYGQSSRSNLEPTGETP
jgi:hypothetical protein